MAEDTDDHLFEEIEEDLRAERYAKLWKRYGKFVIAGFIALIVGVAGFKGWQTYDQKIRAEQSNQYATAARLLAEKKSSERSMPTKSALPYLPRSPKTGVKAIGFYLVFAPPPF